MHEDRLLDLIRQRRNEQRNRIRSLERRGQFILAVAALLGAGVTTMVGGNMTEVWGSALLAGLFVLTTFMLVSALVLSAMSIFPLDGRHLFHAGRSSRAQSWNRWFTNMGLSLIHI